jgi:hypothetical protein
MADLLSGSEGPSPSTIIGNQFFDGLFDKKDYKSNSDTLIANALKEMTLEDREFACHEIHGVADIVDEKPKLVTRCLDEMQQELVKQKARLGLPSAAINLAESMSPEFVNDPKLRIKFLRADRFCAKKAAERMIRYFDFKLSLFGESKLCKEIAFADLEPDEVKLLKKGNIQQLPVRDQAGRAIYVIIANDQRYKSVESLVSYNILKRSGLICFPTSFVSLSLSGPRAFLHE